MLHRIALVALAAGAAAAPAYQAQMDKLFSQADANSDGKFSYGDFSVACGMLGFTDGMVGNVYPKSFSSIFNAADSNSDSFLSKDEFPNLISQNPEIKFKEQLTNTPALPTFRSPDADLINAMAKVTTTLKIAGDLADLFPAKRAELCTYFTIQGSVSGSGTTKCTFLPGSVVFTATSYVLNDLDARSMQTNIAASVGTAALASAQFGVTVTEAPTVVMDFTLGGSIDGAAAFGFVLLVAFAIVASCAFSCVSAKKAGGGDCCAPSNIKVWAKIELVAVFLLLLAMFLLHGKMGGSTDALKKMLTHLSSLAGLSGPTSDATASLPMEQINLIRDNADLLPIAVVVPGVFAALLLLAIGALSHMNAKSLGCAKLVMVFCNIFLLLCFSFYAIFAGFGMAMDQPIVVRQLRGITSICDSLVPDLTQALTDGKNSLDLMNALPAGVVTAADAAEVTTAYNQGLTAFNGFSGTCTEMDNLFAEFKMLFAPGVFAVLAVIFAFMVNFTLCGAAKCCKSPAVAPEGAAK